MNNVNYKGSVAERYMKFSAALNVEDLSTDELFNTINIYIPSYAVESNFTDPTSVKVEETEGKDVAVVAIDSKNYFEVLKSKSKMLMQIEPSFNDGANIDLKYNLVVFYCPTASALQCEKSATNITYSHLSTAFELTYMGAYFKMLYSDSYDEKDVAYFELALCLASLVSSKKYSDLSAAFLYLHQDFTKTTNNKCGILIKTATQEKEAVKEAGFETAAVLEVPSTTYYFWGLLDKLNAFNVWLSVHSEEHNNLFNSIGRMFSVLNSSKLYLGNKLEMVRLSGKDVKPTGKPSLLDGSINCNLDVTTAKMLDEKNVNYYISIASSTGNDVVANSSLTITGLPILAVAIRDFIDYKTSQDLAKIVTDAKTTDRPYLRNQRTYDMIQQVLLSNIQLFSTIGRLTDVALNFPAFPELPPSKTDIIVVQGWQAFYVYELKKVEVSGTVTV